MKDVRPAATCHATFPEKLGAPSPRLKMIFARRSVLGSGLGQPQGNPKMFKMGYPIGKWKQGLTPGHSCHSLAEWGLAGEDFILAEAKDKARLRATVRSFSCTKRESQDDRHRFSWARPTSGIKHLSVTVCTILSALAHGSRWFPLPPNNYSTRRFGQRATSNGSEPGVSLFEGPFWGLVSRDTSSHFFLFFFWGGGTNKRDTANHFTVPIQAFRGRQANENQANDIQKKGEEEFSIEASDVDVDLSRQSLGFWGSNTWVFPAKNGMGVA